MQRRGKLRFHGVAKEAIDRIAWKCKPGECEDWKPENWLSLEEQCKYRIILHLPGRKVRIRGSGLNSDTGSSAKLFDGLIRQRVPWVRESDRAEQLRQDHGPVIIESIAWDE